MYHMMRLTVLKSLVHVHAHKTSPHWEDILTQIKLANVFIEFLFILLHNYSILLCMYIANICSYIASCIFVNKISYSYVGMYTATPVCMTTLS